MTRRLGCPVTHTQTLASLISNKDRYSSLGLVDAMTARRARPNRRGFARFGNRPNRRDFSRGRGPGGLRIRTPVAGRGSLDDHDRAAPGPDRLGDEYGTVSESSPSRLRVDRPKERQGGGDRRGGRWGRPGTASPAVCVYIYIYARERECVCVYSDTLAPGHTTHLNRQGDSPVRQ